MHDKHLFEYAVIRVVPKVEREEFLNIGLILYCAKQKFLQVALSFNEQRILAFSPDMDLDELKENLRAFDKICNGGPEGGPIGNLDLPSRFRWLTATRSTILQTSKVHPGFCTDAKETIERLYNELVL